MIKSTLTGMMTYVLSFTHRVELSPVLIRADAVAHALTVGSTEHGIVDGRLHATPAPVQSVWVSTHAFSVDRPAVTTFTPYPIIDKE